MPKNVMKLLKPSPHRQRNDFDLSHRHVYDANFGELLPATCIETVPGDNITLHASDLLRAIPFVTSPFLRAKQHLDVWFVPYHDLWHQFDAFITQKSEPVSAAFKSAAYCPHVSQYALHSGCAYTLSGTTPKDAVGRDVTDRNYYLLELLGYGDIKNRYGSSDSTFQVNPFRLAAYNFIWYNEYRQQYYDSGSDTMLGTNSVAALFNFDDLTCSSTANSAITDVGRLCSMSQMRYRCWKKDLFTGVLPSTQFGSVSTVPVILDADIPISGSATITGQTGFDVNTHGIYKLNPQNQVVPFGETDWNSSASLDAYGNPITGMFPQAGLAQFGESNITKHFYGQSVNNPDNWIHVQDAQGAPALDLHTHSVSGTGTVSTSGHLSDTEFFDILTLRHREAMQIWRENALRAGNHIKDNMIAHYGVASDFNDHRPTYLGSVSAPLNIGDIATTANSSTGVNNTVGDIAGKGLSSLDEKVFKFHAKDFGVIMVMFSLLPEAEYDAYGIERTNQLLEAEDFFVPEFENIGLEGVSTINFAPGNAGTPSQAGIIGYAPRYYAYKTKLDKVFGSFVGSGINRAWSSQRSDVTTYFNRSTMPQSIPLQFLYVNPGLYDANFNVGISTSPQFLCDVYFDVDAVRPMSVIGLPFS